MSDEYKEGDELFTVSFELRKNYGEETPKNIANYLLSQIDGAVNLKVLKTRVYKERPYLMKAVCRSPCTVYNCIGLRRVEDE
jgi:hypothetical protein